MRYQELRCTGGVAIEHRLHDGLVLVWPGAGAAQRAAAREVAIAVGGVEELAVDLEQPGCSAGGNEVAMKGAVRLFPSRVELQLPRMARRVARHPGEAVIGDNDPLLPGGVALGDAFAQADLGQEAARARQLDQVPLAYRGGVEAAQIGLADKAVARGAVQGPRSGFSPTS